MLPRPTGAPREVSRPDGAFGLLTAGARGHQRGCDDHLVILSRQQIGLDLNLFRIGCKKCGDSRIRLFSASARSSQSPALAKNSAAVLCLLPSRLSSIA